MAGPDTNAIILLSISYLRSSVVFILKAPFLFYLMIVVLFAVSGTLAAARLLTLAVGFDIISAPEPSGFPPPPPALTNGGSGSSSVIELALVVVFSFLAFVLVRPFERKINKKLSAAEQLKILVFLSTAGNVLLAIASIPIGLQKGLLYAVLYPLMMLITACLVSVVTLLIYAAGLLIENLGLGPTSGKG